MQLRCPVFRKEGGNARRKKFFEDNIPSQGPSREFRQEDIRVHRQVRVKTGSRSCIKRKSEPDTKTVMGIFLSDGGALPEKEDRAVRCRIQRGGKDLLPECRECSGVMGSGNRSAPALHESPLRTGGHSGRRVRGYRDSL